MTIKDELSIKINISIAYFVFLFTFSNRYIEIVKTQYGVTTNTSDYPIMGEAILLISSLVALLFLILASIQVSSNLEDKILHKMSGFFFNLNIIMMLLMLIFPVFCTAIPP